MTVLKRVLLKVNIFSFPWKLTMLAKVNPTKMAMTKILTTRSPRNGAWTSYIHTMIEDLILISKVTGRW